MDITLDTRPSLEGVVLGITFVGVTYMFITLLAPHFWQTSEIELH